MHDYLGKLQSSPVRTLSDLIAFNNTHASDELPPGEMEALQHAILLLTPPDNPTQDLLEKSNSFQIRVKGTVLFIEGIACCNLQVMVGD